MSLETVRLPPKVPEDRYNSMAFIVTKIMTKIMKSVVAACLSVACFSVVSFVFMPPALAGSRPNSTNVTFFDWDHNRIDMHISDENLVFNVELRHQNGPTSEYFMGEYDKYRVMYDRDSHNVTVINYLNGNEIYNYNFYEVDSQVDEGSL